MKNFRYFSPNNLNEVLALLTQFDKNIFVMAGGTDLLVRMKDREISPSYIIDLKQIAELNDIKYDESSGLKIGALTTISDIEKSPHLTGQYHALVEAASSMGSAQIRNKGTIGGNLCNASPAADLAPPLIVMDASVQIIGKYGEKIIRMEEFFRGPGKTILQDGEILTEIQVPKLPSGSGTAYLKFSRRRGLDLALASVACLLRTNDFRCEKVRIAMGAVAPIPLRAERAEALIMGKEINDDIIEKVSEIAAEETRPIGDIRASASYRKEIIKVLVKRSIRISLDRIRLRISK